eukprot:CAMPEP_0202685674 /NCGR_PEP_ID=MMETSP1385-20130828/1492_1 /ASSEMBLY_ACC=CAM_ASM_000861 /TAXON_ID=933848 /ORGANISM="Elphidium margaritaceum" /LENGTH=472 /DNA_ID=CAMNT_0049340093 /DNA_START=204 /DNA_END=1622 /DNA_ORIENTATION=+
MYAAQNASLGRKKRLGHWKAKRKEDDDKQTKFGEHNQETVEEDLTVYKKGVYQFDHGADVSANGHTKHLLTKSAKQAPPKMHDEEDTKEDRAPRTKPVPTSRRAIITPNPKHKRRMRGAPMVTVSPSRYGPFDPYRGRAGGGGRRPYGPPPPVAAAPPAGPPPPPYYEYGAAGAYAPYGHYAYVPDSYAYYDANYGVLNNDDGVWYPYSAADALNPPPQVASPKPTRRTTSKKARDSANVDLSTPSAARNAQNKSEKMTPGRRVNKIQKQLEYYFSVQNMENDQFLKESMDKEGWILIEVILGFKRMKYLDATKELVVEAAFHSNVVEIEPKTQDRLRVTTLWKQYVEDNNRRKIARKKQREREKAKEKELDEADLNADTIDSIVAIIEKKMERKQRHRAEKEKEKEKDGKMQQTEKSSTSTTKDTSTAAAQENKNNENDESEPSAAELIRKDKENAQQEEEDLDAPEEDID